MNKKILGILCIFAIYIVVSFFWCNPGVIPEFSPNNSSVENNKLVEEDFTWNGHYALVRFEDVSPASDIILVKNCIELLKNENIPFSIALIPVYKNPEKNITIYLHERPELVRLIKNSGATIVLHGCTHQYDGETGIDFEFWDEISDNPIKQNNTKYAITKIETALKELEKCGISTEIWETPHYTSDDETKKVVSRYFSKTYEGTTDKLVVNEFGQIVVPTNLYYVHGESPIQSVSDIIVEANNISIDSNNNLVASFFYHPYLGTEYLKTIVKSFKEQGYIFVSPKDYIEEQLILPKS